MNRIIPITACGVENMSATEIAELLWEQEQEIERLTAEVKRLECKAEKPGNRVLTLDEVRALPEGVKGWVESTRSIADSAWYVKKGDVLLSSSLLNHWPPASPRNYNTRWRCWSNGEPTADESAAVPWKERPNE